MRTLILLLSVLCVFSLAPSESSAQRYTEDLDDRYCGMEDCRAEFDSMLGDIVKGLGKLAVVFGGPIFAYRFGRNLLAEQKMSDEEFFNKYPHHRGFGREKTSVISTYIMLVLIEAILVFLWLLLVAPQTLKSLMS